MKGPYKEPYKPDAYRCPRTTKGIDSPAAIFRITAEKPFWTMKKNCVGQRANPGNSL
jgi:hypothetical protein